MMATLNEKKVIINHEERIIGRKEALEVSFISKMKDRRYNRTAVNQMIGGMSHSISSAKERLLKVGILADNLLAQMEIDYSDGGDKEMLRPQNEREYWLFTEIHQRLKDFCDEIRGVVE